jgi:hypothetical protein
MFLLKQKAGKKLLQSHVQFLHLSIWTVYEDSSFYICKLFSEVFHLLF